MIHSVSRSMSAMITQSIAQSMKQFLPVLLVLTLPLSRFAFGETKSSAGVKSLPQLIPLTKLTVGPDDQYDATISPDESLLVVTHKADLVAHLRVQNLQSGEVKDLTPLTADAQSAQFSSDGRLVFTYFRDHARGEICYTKSRIAFRTLADSDISCLKRAPQQMDSERSNPFWRSARELGYLVRDISSQRSTLVIENIETRQRTELVGGVIWGPNMNEGGRYLVFNQSTENGGGHRQLMLMDLETKKTEPIRLDLPGLTGLSRFSPDGQFIFISHFLKDTNADNAVDGRDNSVLFRIPLGRLLSAAGEQKLFPEQLTSIETSCSFPKASKTALYTTCAFENSLDIYRIPLSGIVPTEWAENNFQSANRTARSYPERILLNNVARYRFQTSQPLDLISNYVLSDDYASALFELEKESKIHPDATWLKPLRLYFTARRLFRSQEQSLYRTEYLSEMKTLKSEVTSTPDGVLSALVKLHFDQMTNETSTLLARLSKVPLLSRSTTLEAYLYHELLARLFPQASNAGRDGRPSFETAFEKLFRVQSVSVEGQMFYLFDFLRQLDTQWPSPQESLAVVQRLRTSIDKSGNADQKLLLDAEILDLDIIIAGTSGDVKARDANQIREFAKLDKVLAQAKPNYFLRKAINVRAVTLFAKFDQLRYLDFVAADWIRDTLKTDTEFVYARELVSSTSLSEGYAYWAKGQYQLANGYFYNSLTLTDDLESHAGYIKLQYLLNKQAGLEKQYTYLRGHKLTEDNYKFFQALQTILELDRAPDNTNHKTEDKQLEKKWDESLAVLESIGPDRNSASRYLLVGAIYLKKVLLSRHGAEFSQSSFQEAHRNLMLAYDQGLGNDRVRSAALMDLGTLHAVVGNYNMSSRFFLRRQTYGFTNKNQEMAFANLYAKSLFHSFQAAGAAEVFAKYPAETLPAPMVEREAFYWAMAEDFNKSKNLYSLLLTKFPPTDTESLAKVQLVDAYVLYKSKQPTDSLAMLELCLKNLDRIGKITDNDQRLVPTDPELLKMTALGLKAQVETRAEAGLSDWSERLQILNAHKKNLESSAEWILKAELQVAHENFHLRRLDEMQKALGAAVKTASAIGVESTFLNHDVSETLLQTLSALILSQASGAAVDGAHAKDAEVLGRGLSALYQDYLRAYDQEADKSPQLIFESLKIQMAWRACVGRYVSLKLSDVRRIDDPYDQEVKNLNSAIPEKWTELKKWEARLNAKAL